MWLSPLPSRVNNDVPLTVTTPVRWGSCANAAHTLSEQWASEGLRAASQRRSTTSTSTVTREDDEPPNTLLQTSTVTTNILRTVATPVMVPTRLVSSSRTNTISSPATDQRTTERTWECEAQFKSALMAVFEHREIYVYYYKKDSRDRAFVKIIGDDSYLDPFESHSDFSMYLAIEKCAMENHGLIIRPNEIFNHYPKETFHKVTLRPSFYCAPYGKGMTLYIKNAEKVTIEHIKGAEIKKGKKVLLWGKCFTMNGMPFKKGRSVTCHREVVDLTQDEKTDDDKSGSYKRECSVCMDGEVTMMAVTCHHVCLCMKCATSPLMKKCPMCRSDTDFVRVYM